MAEPRKEKSATECLCPYCDTEVEEEAVFCVACEAVIFDCVHCGEPVRDGVEVCPHCGEPPRES